MDKTKWEKTNCRACCSQMMIKHFVRARTRAGEKRVQVTVAHDYPSALALAAGDPPNLQSSI